MKTSKILRILTKPSALILTILLTFSGCYWNIPVIDLLSPPMLTQEQTAIFEALTNAEGDVLTLKYPKSGEFLSAFVFFPNDGNRVMVFHERSGSAEATIWLTFLENRGENRGRWVVTHSLAFFAMGIEQVEFSDLGDSDTQNIIISTSLTGQADKNLYVIAFDENTGAPVEVFRRDFCIFYQIGDFDGSGRNMLMSINMSVWEDSDESLIWFSGWRDSYFDTLYSVRTTSAIEYERAFVGTVRGPLPEPPPPPEPPEDSEDSESSEDSETSETPEIPEPEPPELFTAVFIEYSTSTISNTSVIVWQDGRPRNITFMNDTNLTKRPNQFTAHAYARDIDGSGTVNPAGNFSFPGYDEIHISERVRAAIWYEVVIGGGSGGSGDAFERLYYTYLSVNDDFVFFFPDGWEGNVTVTVNNEPTSGVVNEVVFWEYDSARYTGVHDVSRPMLIIITVPAGEMLSDEVSGWDDFVRFFASGAVENTQYDYYVRVHNLSISRSELRESLRFF